MNSRTNIVRKSCPQAERPLADYFAQMAADSMNALAVLKGPGGLWREYEVACEIRRELGAHPRRACAIGVAVRAARTIAHRDGLPWPSLEETLEQTLANETHL